MSNWSAIVQMLLDDKELRELIIAPNAPPVSRRTEGRRVLSSQVFSAAAVAETLTTAASHATARRPGELGQAGVVCLGVRDVGRVRISYFTQRGSRVLRIVRVPFDVPIIDSICVEPPQAHDLAQAISAGRYRAILIYGHAQMNNSALAYALLGEMNHTQRLVIYIAERTLSFLLKHDNSVVVQVEVVADAASLEDAIQQSLFLEPDVVFLGDVRMTDSLPSLPQLISANTRTILTTVSEDPILVRNLLPAYLRNSLHKHDAGLLLHVSPADNGKLHLTKMPWLPSEAAGKA